MKKKVTIGDIAKALNISKTTVSFVINGKARDEQISEVLEKKVLKYIDEVGYKPNLFAQSLRTGKTKIIAMLVEDIADPFFASIARYAEDISFQNGYKIIFSSTENNVKKTKEMLRVYRSQQIDGYIIAPVAGIEKAVEELISEGFPVVMFDRTLKGIDTDAVLVDNYDSTLKAIDHLITNGYDKIAFITLESDMTQMQERLRGYQDGMEKAQLAPHILTLPYDREPEYLIPEIEKYISANKELNALFFATNYIADNGLQAIVNLQINIPEELGILVFDDQIMYKILTPSITAIAQPLKKISEASLHLLLAKLKSKTKKELPSEKVILKTDFVIRESTRKRK